MKKLLLLLFLLLLLENYTEISDATLFTAVCYRLLKAILEISFMPRTLKYTLHFKPLHKISCFIKTETEEVSY
jgi:hypothetical protein